jgi:eukaryotic translation initiation factor 2C
VVNVGNLQNPIYLPAEVCDVLPGQPSNAKLSPKQTSEMIKFAVRKPADNAESIVTKGVQVIGVSPQLNACLVSLFPLSLQSAIVLIDISRKTSIYPSIQL